MSGIPPLSGATIPADVKAGGKEEIDRYRTALGFERMLVGELLKTSNLDLGVGPYANNATDTLTDAITQNGGTGIADDLYRAMKGSA